MRQTDTKSRAKGWSGLPLKFKLISCFLLFAVVMIVFLWLFQIVFLDDFYRLIKTEQIRNCTESVAENIDDPEIESLIDEIYAKNDMAVSVFDTSSAIFTRVYTTKAQQELGLEIMPHEVYTCYNTAKESGKQVLMELEPVRIGDFFSDDRDAEKEISPRFERESAKGLFCAQVVTGEDGTEYLVLLKSTMTPITSTVDTLRIQLVIITAILVAFAVVFAIVVSQNISTPLVKTNEGAKELARHNYGITFEGNGCREICELSNTLNITARELSNVDRLRRELIANISHDLRTPLTMISGYAEVMRDIPGENTPENVQVIIDESQRLSSLVTDLLDLSKLESRNLPVNMEEFCITDTIRDIFTRYSKLVSQEGYKFDFECDCECFVCGDELRLTQVIYNLVNNAVNYAGEDKTVTVKQTVQNGKVRIEVTDHGEGIAPEDLKHIWDRYYRVDKEHRSAKIGTGLGLSIAKNVLELHGARFGVMSKLGCGSTFWFELEVLSAETL